MLVELHQPHQEDSTKHHEAGPQQVVQGHLNGVFPPKDGIIRVCITEIAHHILPLHIEHMFDVTGLSLLFCLISLAFRCVETLRERLCQKIRFTKICLCAHLFLFIAWHYNHSP